MATAASSSSLRQPLLAAGDGAGSEAAAAAAQQQATDGDGGGEFSNNNASFSLGTSATIAFWHIRYEVPDRLKKGKKKTLLDDISGIVRPGQVLAIMGPSGCGKTSILEILGARNSPTSGGLAANGRLYDGHTRKYIGLVPQDEALFPTLTVRESLLFSAELRLPAALSQKEKEARVEQVLEELNLVSVKDSLIGDKLKRGVSGGERKRVSMGKELCYQPKLLLLDEPTSGLDSFTSVKVMKLLRKLAERGRTLACTIHQPSSDIFAKFDQLMLLVSGRVVYYGEASVALRYFEQLGLCCPRYANPADFFLSLCDESEEPCPPNDPHGPTPKAFVARLVRHYHASPIKDATLHAIDTEISLPSPSPSTTTRTHIHTHAHAHPHPPAGSEGVGVAERKQEEEEEDGDGRKGASSGRWWWWRPRGRGQGQGQGEMEKEKEQQQQQRLLMQQSMQSQHEWAPRNVRWYTQFSVLCRRSLLHTCRNPLSSYVILGRTIVMSLLVGSLYYQLDLSAEGVMNREGAIFFVLINQVFSSLGSLHLLLDEQEIVSHESRSAMYPVSAYYMAKQVAELPIQLSTTALFAIITYWMVGFQKTVGHFLNFMAAMILTGLVGESYILVCGSITTSSKVAITIAPVFMALLMLFGGFFINSASVPPYYAWIKYISLFNYLNGALQKNELEGLTFEGGLTGEQVIASLHLMALSVWENLAVICGMIVGFRALAFVFVRRNFTPRPFALPPGAATSAHYAAAAAAAAVAAASAPAPAVSLKKGNGPSLSSLPAAAAGVKGKGDERSGVLLSMDGAGQKQEEEEGESKGQEEAV